ncbi:hypothetical protein Cpap_0435 [Ruminiclostridium papyrosolvens DSM 2782]|uniref:Uncharacterized protein n=1 Tax=Ruminiclostridium papyrosolvens DSM 2782 TaxID=588581 RepID=F1THD8_9FIRM|nr:hypothetical protein Cpap_0435 [Ruminiclostridium papyrosolvens DSM 2782]
MNENEKDIQTTVNQQTQKTYNTDMMAGLAASDACTHTHW